MAELRLIVLALCACRAEAAPAGIAVPAGGRLAVPPSWHELPELAKAVGGDAAWGEPAMGCYAAQIAMKGRAKPPDGFAITDVVAPDGDGVLAFAFAKDAYHGRVRAKIAGDTRAMLCFWNEREPAACEAACTQLLGGVQ